MWIPFQALLLYSLPALVGAAIAAAISKGFVSRTLAALAATASVGWFFWSWLLEQLAPRVASGKSLANLALEPFFVSVAVGLVYVIAALIDRRDKTRTSALRAAVLIAAYVVIPLASFLLVPALQE